MASRHVVITGGFGFLGQELTKVLLAEGQLLGVKIGKIIIVDIVQPNPLPAFCSDPRIEVQLGSPEDAAFCDKLMACGENPLSVFHLAGIMSGQGEKDFDLCLTVNMDVSRNLMQAARKAKEGSKEKARFVFASTAAVFGFTEDRPVSDTTKQVPLNTYGMTKACCELMLNDFTRKGFVDGRAARLPTVIVRPGKPNAASTSCFSGVIREPLHGDVCELPVERHLPHGVSSTRAIVGGIKALHECQWPDGLVDRAVNLPSISITLQELIDGMFRVVAASDHGKLGKIVDKIDQFLNGVVGGMAGASMKNERALKLGLPVPGSVDSIIGEFLTDFGEKCVVKASATAQPAQSSTPSCFPCQPCMGSLGSFPAAGGARQAAAQPATFGARVEAKIPGKKVAVVTGAGTGVGKACATALVEKAGFTAIVLVGRRKEPLEETLQAMLKLNNQASVLIQTCDVTKPDAVQKLFQKVELEYGRVDCLFNNAGTNAPPVPFDELSPEIFNNVISTNVTGVWLCAREAFSLMKRQQPKGGRIINNGSISADRPRPCSAAYTASKHAVTGLTKTIALDGRAHDIACGQINIGNALTEMASGIAKGALQPSGEKVPEPCFDVKHVGDAVAYMAGLPNDTNTLEMTVMATKAPLVGRG